MARIRTIKPDFFRHEELYDAEKQSGLPLRVAFAGLWTAADREGRFRWQPRALKLDCLPYDDVDFSRVLDVLATRGFIIKYAISGEAYGAIPGWKKHQVINNRESDSILPEPTEETRITDASATRHGLAQGEGKGKEGEGKGKGKEETREVALSPDDLSDFDAFWDEWPNKVGKPAALKAFKAAVRRGASLWDIQDGLRSYVRDKPPDRPWLNPATFLNQERWKDRPATLGAAKNGQSGEISAASNKLVESLKRGFGGAAPQEHFGGGTDAADARLLSYRGS